METNEHDSPQQPRSASVNAPVLPPDLAIYLRGCEPYAALYHPTNVGTSIVAKLPAFEIEAVRGTVPMHLRHLLYSCPTAPVIRSILTVFDKPSNPLALETFINVADHQQREDFASLGWQSELYLYFYDEQLTPRLSKRIAGFPQPEVLTIIDEGIEVLRRIPKGTFDYDRAKASVIEMTSL